MLVMNTYVNHPNVKHNYVNYANGKSNPTCSPIHLTDKSALVFNGCRDGFLSRCSISDFLYYLYEDYSPSVLSLISENDQPK